MRPASGVLVSSGLPRSLRQLGEPTVFARSSMSLRSNETFKLGNALLVLLKPKTAPPVL